MNLAFLPPAKAIKSVLFARGMAKAIAIYLDDFVTPLFRVLSSQTNLAMQGLYQQQVEKCRAQPDKRNPP